MVVQGGRVSAGLLAHGAHRDAVLRAAHDHARLARENGPVGLVLRVVGVLVGWMVRGV